jgi:hypothetical protein
MLVNQCFAMFKQLHPELQPPDILRLDWLSVEAPRIELERGVVVKLYPVDTAIRGKDTPARAPRIMCKGVAELMHHDTNAPSGDI